MTFDWWITSPGPANKAISMNDRAPDSVYLVSQSGDCWCYWPHSNRTYVQAASRWCSIWRIECERFGPTLCHQLLSRSPLIPFSKLTRLWPCLIWLSSHQGKCLLEWGLASWPTISKLPLNRLVSELRPGSKAASNKAAGKLHCDFSQSVGPGVQLLGHLHETEFLVGCFEQPFAPNMTFANQVQHESDQYLVLPIMAKPEPI